MTPPSGGNLGKNDALQGTINIYEVYSNIKSHLKPGIEENLNVTESLLVKVSMLRPAGATSVLAFNMRHLRYLLHLLTAKRTWTAKPLDLSAVLGFLWKDELNNSPNWRKSIYPKAIDPHHSRILFQYTTLKKLLKNIYPGFTLEPSLLFIFLYVHSSMSFPKGTFKVIQSWLNSFTSPKEILG